MSTPREQPLLPVSIGVDVGGTNTDAVLLEGTNVRAAYKTATTHDTTTGIERALAEVVSQQRDLAARARGLTIGTTHFVNAVVQRRGLNRAAALRICLPACASLPPFVDWPADLAAVVNGGTYLVGGGFEFDGRELAPLDEEAVAAAARDMRDNGVTAVGITAVFSPLSDALETRAAAIVQAEHPSARITLSARIGRIGLLERENAALLNASLADLAAHTASAFERAREASGLTAPIYITQNDGTVAPVDHARQFPVFSFASGPTNSMRGAAFLAGEEHAVVCDVGGTTTDVGCLQRGFPREANNVISIGGVRTLFRMPDVLSVGLGGGTRVRAEDGSVVLGPDSVGHRLIDEALVFGGDTLTCTDVAVAAGRAQIGDHTAVISLERTMVDEVLARIESMVDETVDRMKTDAAAVPLLAVGGGAMLIPDKLPGISEVRRVAHYDVANAVGAAIAEVSGEVDRIYRDVPRDEAFAHASDLAASNAIAAGADPDGLRTVEKEDFPLAYLPGNALRIRVRVVGALTDR